VDKIRRHRQEWPAFDERRFVEAVENVCERPIKWFGVPLKKPDAVAAKELLLFSGIEAGATLKSLAALTVLNTSTASRRHDAARGRAAEDTAFCAQAAAILKRYEELRELQA
jgi:hypothetical protein